MSQDRWMWWTVSSLVEWRWTAAQKTWTKLYSSQQAQVGPLWSTETADKLIQGPHFPSTFKQNGSHLLLLLAGIQWVFKDSYEHANKIRE